MSTPSMLGSYPVERELGRGGMGVVYLARDPRLNRLVAIKIVPEALALNPDNMARFEREAKLLAAVNHPNIASIYGVEETPSTSSGQGGQRLLIMEYVPGETLADRLSLGPLPIAEALDVGRQIAAAVEAAHEGGIIHRDLKPGNVRLTPDGTVKVLDFGLAKGGVVSDAELAQSPTLTYSPTGLGVILGTAGYMSPEQARGKPVDRRADVWAFGCVLFECLTGKKTFEGETVSDTIARILEREPVWSDLPAATPARVRELLRRCLEKDLKKRQRDVGDVRIEIEEALAAKSLSSSFAVGPAVTQSTAQARPSWLLVAAGAVVGAALGIGVWSASRGTSAPPTPPVSLSMTVPSSIRAIRATFPKDGADFVILGGVGRLPDGTEERQGRVYYRQLGSYEFAAVPGSEGTITFSRSPDGRSLALIKPVSEQSTDQRLYKVTIDGSSPPVPIIDWDPDWGDYIWLQNGDLLVMTAAQTKFFRLPVGGGGAKPPMAFDLGQATGFPIFLTELPEGHGVLMQLSGWGPRGYQEDIWRLDPNTGKCTKVIENAGDAHFLASTNHLLFSHGSALMAVRFDLSKGTATGDTVPLFDGLRSNLWSNGGFSVSPSGHLLFEPGGRVGVDRRIVTVSASRDVTPYVADARPYESAMSASHDGTQVAVVIPNARGTYEIWQASSSRSGLRRTISFSNVDAYGPAWSPDSTWIAFDRNGRDKDDGVYVMRADGSGAPRPVLKVAKVEDGMSVLDWSKEGLVVTRTSSGRTEMVLVPMSAAGEPAAPKVLVGGRTGGLGRAQLSPDGKYLAYISDESGKMELQVAAITNGAIGGQPLVLTSGGATDVRWSSDSTRIYARQNPGRIMVTTLERTPSLKASAPVLAYDLNALRLDSAVWDILPDGRLLGLQRGAGEDDITSYGIVLNWLEQIKAKLPK